MASALRKRAAARGGYVDRTTSWCCVALRDRAASPFVLWPRWPVPLGMPLLRLKWKSPEKLGINPREGQRAALRRDDG
jgi:hypothetical protein